jgi:hypothetical protein
MVTQFSPPSKEYSISKLLIFEKFQEMVWVEPPIKDSPPLGDNNCTVCALKQENIPS